MALRGSRPTPFAAWKSAEFAAVPGAHPAMEAKRDAASPLLRTTATPRWPLRASSANDGEGTRNGPSSKYPKRDNIDSGGCVPTCDDNEFSNKQLKHWVLGLM